MSDNRAKILWHSGAPHLWLIPLWAALFVADHLDGLDRNLLIGALFGLAVSIARLFPGKRYSR